MQRLLILITLFFSYQLSHAASLPQTLAEQRAQYCQILEMPATSSLKQIKTKFNQLALTLHPDKNQENPQALQKFQKINEAYRFLIAPENNPKTPKKSLWSRLAFWKKEPKIDLEKVAEEAHKKQDQEAATKAQLLQDEVLPFLERCDRYQEVAKKCAPEQSQELEKLKQMVEDQGYVKPENTKALQAFEFSLEHQRRQLLQKFTNSCDALARRTFNKRGIHNLINKTNRQGYTSQDDEDTLAALTEKVVEKERFREKVSAIQRKPSVQGSYYTRLNNLCLRVWYQESVNATDDNELRTIEAEVAWQEALDFISLCNNEMLPCGNSTEHYAELQRLIKAVQDKRCINDVDTKALEHIKQNKKEAFLAQCKQLKKENREANGSSSVDASADSIAQDVTNNIHRVITPENQQHFLTLDAQVQRTKYWKGPKEKAQWIFSVAAPIALALGQGLLLNLLAHRAGSDLKQVAFYKAPAREWAIGFATLCLQGILGINLGKKLKAKYSHSFSDSLYAAAYLMSIGTLQHLGERLPLAGTGWRAPINPHGSWLTNLLFSNSSLFTGSAGSVALALSKAVGY